VWQHGDTSEESAACRTPITAGSGSRMANRRYPGARQGNVRIASGSSSNLGSHNAFVKLVPAPQFVSSCTQLATGASI